MNDENKTAFAEATINDADAILSLVHQLEHFITKETLLNNLKKNIEHNEYCIFVAKENETVIAFAEIHFTQFIHEAQPRARLTAYCVDAKHRNKNIGSAFLGFLENVCKQQHVSRLELTSNIKRTDAHRFYEKNGYAFTSKRFYKDL
ncbi:MAG: GNAT family N-acetyltransferase [Chitinophagales bacterium]